MPKLLRKPFHKLPFGIAVVLMLQVNSAWSETRTQIWSFEQIARQILATHPAIMSQQSYSKAAQADLDTASWQRYPVPSLGVTREEGGRSTTVLTVQQPLWTGGKITANINAAQSRFGIAEAAINETQRGVIFNLIDAFLYFESMFLMFAHLNQLFATKKQSKLMQRSFLLDS